MWMTTKDPEGTYLPTQVGRDEEKSWNGLLVHHYVCICI